MVGLTSAAPTSAVRRWSPARDGLMVLSALLMALTLYMVFYVGAD